MSVQAGMWNFDGQPPNPEWLATISRATSKYGRDGETIYSNGAVGLLYRPFHATQESHVERQPHKLAKGDIVLWDGRLDNREELLRQFPLTGEKSDVAIVAASYERCGTECFEKLIGDWALSIWIPQQEELILARDYVGTRHLFYHAAAHSFTWCTQLSPLVMSGDSFNICHEYVAGYLALYPPSDLTPYREIRSVPPGKFIRVRPSGLTTHTYWAFTPVRTHFRSDAEYEERFGELFAQAVRRRLRTDSKILADLSGGLDSSSIVAVADKLHADEPTATSTFDTFSCFDEDEPGDEDLLYIEVMERVRGRRGHHASVRTTGDTFSFEFPEFVATPGFDGRQEFRTAHQDVLHRFNYRVLLSGQGGDEVNGQALDFRIPIADSLSRFRLRRATQQLMTWSLRSRYPLIQLLMQSSELLLPVFLRWNVSAHMTEMSGWIDGHFARQHGMSDDLRASASGSWRWLPSARDAYQTIELLARDMTNRRPSCVDIRYPYLDRTLVEFLTSIPTDQLLRAGSRRSLMRRALSRILPPEIVSRRTKASTGRCVVLTLQKHWTLVENLLRAPLISELGYVRADAFRTVMEHTKNGHFIDLVRTLRTLALECWLRQAVKHGVLSISRAELQVRTSAVQGQLGQCGCRATDQELNSKERRKAP